MLRLMPFKVASYNIHKAVGADRQYAPERSLAVIADLAADVVMLQEADRRFGTRGSVLPQAMIATRTHLRPVVFDHNPMSLGWHGNAALVSERVTVTGAVRIDLPSLEPRGAIMVETLIDGRPVRFCGMHLDLTGVRRRRQLHHVRALVGARPVAMPTVLMGDLNEWRGRSGIFDDLAADYVIAATGPSFPARLPLGRLDRIMVGRGLEVADCGTQGSGLARIASDHLPVWATLRLVEPH